MASGNLSVVSDQSRKARGAFFTPPAIAEFLVDWAIDDRPGARILDPTCGDGVFLEAAGKALRELGSDRDRLADQIFGIDVHAPSVAEAALRLRAQGLDATLREHDFFAVDPPTDLLSELPLFDVVCGNPPFVRYQQHRGEERRLSALAALRQGVRLSGLASSWAALLVHASAFLAPDGRLAMVVPAELLTVGYAEPVRQWLRRRFGAVRLVIFERLQFEDALENVVLLLASGMGGCDAFSLCYVRDADDLAEIRRYSEAPVALSDDGKWTDLFLPVDQRQLFKRVVEQHFSELGIYGPPELGTVTGANDYFALSETTREKWGLIPDRHVKAISPPGTRHFSGAKFTKRDWLDLKASGAAVWLLHPDSEDDSPELARYLEYGEQLGVHTAYKCQIRRPWWRPPIVTPPDLFFTYMSHRYPRLIVNKAKVTFLNSMHGVRLQSSVPRFVGDALPFLALNSVTMLGAEVRGRSYGGGILKMEPREAAILPVPGEDVLREAWAIVAPERDKLENQLKMGLWPSVVSWIDEVLLRRVLNLTPRDANALREAALNLRQRRLRRPSHDVR